MIYFSNITTRKNTNIALFISVCTTIFSVLLYLISLILTPYERMKHTKTQWVIGSKIPTDSTSGQYGSYRLALKDMPNWHITPQIARINQHITSH